MSPIHMFHVAAGGALAAQAGIDPTTWYNLAGLAGGCCWLVAYVIAVYDGLKRRRCALPVYAVCLNLSWEILTSFFVANPIPVWLWVNRGWLVMDLVIAYTLVRYGRQRVAAPGVARHFHVIMACGLALGLAGEMTFITSFRDAMGSQIAFVIDLFMAIFFVLDFLAAPIPDDATLAIGWARLLGDLGVIIQYYYLFPQVDSVGSFAFFHFLFVAILALDALYVVLLWRARRAATAAPRLSPA